MPLIAITREVSPSINDCELSFHPRQPIDVAAAIAQHQSYQKCLTELGVRIISLPAEPALSDAVFVEDAAVVVDEVAVIPIMGAPSRRLEVESIARALKPYRPLKFFVQPGTLDGGDVLRIGRDVFVGLSRRTNNDGLVQLRHFLRPQGYKVQPIAVERCLHLKSACSDIGDGTLLINRSWIDAGKLSKFNFIDVPEEEPGAANALRIEDTVIISARFPKTRARLEQKGFRVRPIDLSELQKAEAGVTCTSLIFNDASIG
jgi:dimethylargininase